MDTQGLALRSAVALAAALTGCSDLWGGFDRDNPLHCANRADTCQSDQVCNMQTGLCDAVPITDVITPTAGSMSCTASGALQACWQAYQLPNTQAALRAVWTDGPSDVWVVGDAGLVLRYDGQKWHKVASGTQANLNAVWGTGASDVWVVGDAATALHWTGSGFAADGGPSGNSGVQDFCCIWGSSASDLWVAASHTSADQYVLSHFSSGAWTRINPAQTMPARMVPQALTGLREGMLTTVQLVGQSLLVKTDDNQFPAVVASAIANQPRGAAINAGLVGFLVGQGGSIERSANGQLSGYAAVPSPTTSNLRDLFATSDGTLVAVGEGGTTLARTQGTWRVESAVTTASLNRVWGTDSTNVWAVGDAGTILGRTLK